MSPLLTWEGEGEVPNFCPEGCGGLTEDPYGGPCKTCWDAIGRVSVTADEWEGDVHVLTVHAVHPPDGPFDDGELDCDIEHPPSCKQEDCGYDGVPVMIYTCDVAQTAGDVGLPFSLRYSGTPVTEPGTYRIRAWGRKYWTELGGEHDGGVGTVEEEALCGSP